MNTREKTCTTCRDPFEAIKKNGKWPSTCSPPCRLAALERLIDVLRRQRDRLSAELEG